MRKSKFMFVLIIAIALMGLMVGMAVAKDKVKIIDGYKAVKGKLAPRFEADTTTGDVFNLEDLREKKCVVISFWATWCGPCVGEFPYLQKFYEKHKDTCEVIGISKDAQRDKKVLENKVKELKVTFPIIHDYGDKIRTKLYPSKLIPYLVVIGRDGTVKSLIMGSANPKALGEELEKLLGDDLKPLTKEEPKEESDETEKEEPVKGAE